MEDLSGIEQIINGDSGGLTEADITGFMSQMFLWILLPSILISVVILVLFIIHSVRRRKLENALFEIRDILRDMHNSNTTPPPILKAEPLAVSEQPEPENTI